MKKVLLIFLILITILLVACQNNEIENNIIEYSVSILVASEDTIDEIVVLPAKVSYYELTHLSFAQGGILESIFVKEGEIIHKDKILAKLDEEAYSTNLMQSKNNESSSYQEYLKAQSNYNYIAEQYSNMKILFDSGAISKNELDQYKLNYNIAFNSLQSAKDQWDSANEYYLFIENSERDYMLTADSDGIIAYVHFEQNEIVAPGVPIISIAKKGSYLSAFVSKELLNVLQIGGKVNIDGGGVGEIVELATNPDPITLQYKIIIKSELEMIIGDSTTIEKTMVSYSGIILPINAIIGQENGYYVFAAEDNRAVKYDIEVKQVVNQYVLVEGIENGQKIIFEGNKMIKEGDYLNIVEAAL